MKCPQCGKKTPPNPLMILLSGISFWLMVLFLDNVTPNPGFWSDWHWFMWWLCALACGFDAVFFLFAAVIWLSDPHGYKLSWNKPQS